MLYVVKNETSQRGCWRTECVCVVTITYEVVLISSTHCTYIEYGSYLPITLNITHKLHMVLFGFGCACEKSWNVGSSCLCVWFTALKY